VKTVTTVCRQLMGIRTLRPTAKKPADPDVRLTPIRSLPWNFSMSTLHAGGSCIPAVRNSYRAWAAAIRTRIVIASLVPIAPSAALGGLMPKPLMGNVVSAS